MPALNYTYIALESAMIVSCDIFLFLLMIPLSNEEYLVNKSKGF